MRTPLPSGDLPFWRERHGLDLAGARALPGGQAVEVRFHFGQVYRIELSTLGFAGPATLASPGRGRDTLVLFLGQGQTAEIATNRLLAVADADYRTHLAALEAAGQPVGARIRALRKRARRTAVDVARAVGLTPGNYARLEADRHEPRLATLRRVAAALGASVADLLDES